jgi:hypothetical protein
MAKRFLVLYLTQDDDPDFHTLGMGKQPTGFVQVDMTLRERDTYIYILYIYIYLHIHARIYVQLQQENARKPPRWGILSSCTEPGDRLPGSSNAINHCGMGKTHLQLTSTDSEFSNVIFVKF